MRETRAGIRCSVDERGHDGSVPPRAAWPPSCGGGPVALLEQSGSNSRASDPALGRVCSAAAASRGRSWLLLCSSVGAALRGSAAHVLTASRRSRRTCIWESCSRACT